MKLNSKEIALTELSYSIPQFMVTLARLQRTPKPDNKADLWHLRDELVDAREEFDRISSIVDDYVNAYYLELTQQFDVKYDPLSIS